MGRTRLAEREKVAGRGRAVPEGLRSQSIARAWPHGHAVVEPSSREARRELVIPLSMEREDRADEHPGLRFVRPTEGPYLGSTNPSPPVDPQCPPAYTRVHPTKVRVRNISPHPNIQDVFRTEHTIMFQMEHGMNHGGCFRS